MKLKTLLSIFLFSITFLVETLHASERVFSDAVIEKICQSLTFNDRVKRASQRTALQNSDSSYGYYFLVGYSGSDEENSVGHIAIITPDLYLNVFPSEDEAHPYAINAPLADIEDDVEFILLIQCSKKDLDKINTVIKNIQEKLSKKSLTFSLGKLEIVCHKLSYTFPHNFKTPNNSFKEIVKKFANANGFGKIDIVGDTIGIAHIFAGNYSLEKSVFLRYALPKHEDHLTCCISAVLAALSCHPGLTKMWKTVDDSDLESGFVQKVQIANLTGGYGPLQACSYHCEMKTDIFDDLRAAIESSTLAQVSPDGRRRLIESLGKIQERALEGYNRPSDVGLQVASAFAGIGGWLLGGIIGAVAAGRSVNDNGELTFKKDGNSLIYTAKAENPGAMVRRLNDCRKALESDIQKCKEEFEKFFPLSTDRKKILFAVFSRILLSQDTHCQPAKFLSNLHSYDEGSHMTAMYSQKQESGWNVNLSFFDSMKADDLRKFLETEVKALYSLSKALKLNEDLLESCMNEFKHAIKQRIVSSRPDLELVIDQVFGELDPVVIDIDLENRHWGQAFKELVALHKT